jgi:SAM-dependent methyltransferase
VQRPGWWPDEAARGGEEHLDAQRVASYDEKAQNDPAADVALLKELGLDSTSTVVDLGAGTGTFAVAAAAVCKRVVAVDVSPAMLELTARKAAAQRATNVELIRAGLLTYDHVGPSVDFVYSRNVLHHLPDFWKAIALERIAAMLRPGRHLRLRDLVFSFDARDAAERVEAWLAAAPTDPARGWTRRELETHLKDEHSTFTWLLEPMLERAGLAIVASENSESGIFAAYTCRREA